MFVKQLAKSKVRIAGFNISPKLWIHRTNCYQSYHDRLTIYGRRRIGKTFLVRHAFQEKFTFYITGIANINLSSQLTNFYAGLVRYFPWMEDKKVPDNWFQAFQNLISALEVEDEGHKILFFDELPWLDSANSNFIPALEHFWNSWASARNDVVLITINDTGISQMVDRPPNSLWNKLIQQPKRQEKYYFL